MAKANHPFELVGTWQWLETYSKTDEVMPPSPTMPKIVYVFAPDGSAGFMPGHFPGAPTGMPMRWGVIDGRLRIGGAKGLKGTQHSPVRVPRREPPRPVRPQRRPQRLRPRSRREQLICQCT
jgi:hypothetical protein